MWCLQCNSEKTQSLLELELDGCVEGEVQSSEPAPLDRGSGYGPLTHSSSISPDTFDGSGYGQSSQPGPQRPRRPKLQHSQSILRKQAEEEAIKRSRSLSESYELSTDLQDKQVEMLERKYGGRFISRHAARTIQTAFRQYQMNKNFERLRSSMSENRMSRRIVLSNMRMQFSFEGPEKVHSSFFEGKQMSLSDEGSQMGAVVQTEGGDVVPVHMAAPAAQNDLSDAITELEDAFSRQVKSLAESIDDALNCRSLHEEEELPEQVQDLQGKLPYQVKPAHGGDRRKLDNMMASYSDVTLFIDEEDLSPPIKLTHRSADPASSTESEQRAQSVNSSQDYWSMDNKEDKVDTDTSCRSTPSLECQEPRLRMDHLPLLTIEPPSDSSAEMSDRSEIDSVKRQSVYEQRTVAGPQASPKHIAHGLPPRGPSLPRDEEPIRHRHRQLESHLAINGNRQSKSESDFSDGDNDSINSTSNSTDTINCSSESSSRDSVREQTLSKQTYHKETRNSWDSPAFSNDIIRKRYYRIGLNLFNKYVFRSACAGIGLKVHLVHSVGLSILKYDTSVQLYYAICNPVVLPQDKPPFFNMKLSESGVDDGEDIPREMLIGIYERIRQKELKTNEDHVSQVQKVEKLIVGKKPVTSQLYNIQYHKYKLSAFVFFTSLAELEKQKGVVRPTMSQSMSGLKKEAGNGTMSRASLDDTYAMGEGLKRSALSSSLRDLSEAGEYTEKGLMDESLKLMFNGSIISSPHLRRREPSSARECPPRPGPNPPSSSTSLLGSLFGSKRGKPSSQGYPPHPHGPPSHHSGHPTLISHKPHPTNLHHTAQAQIETHVVHGYHGQRSLPPQNPPPYHHHHHYHPPQPGPGPGPGPAPGPRIYRQHSGHAPVSHTHSHHAPQFAHHHHHHRHHREQQAPASSKPKHCGISTVV
uniref:IQ motif and Sec7 domain ArfGEF 1 n=1 Tax=Astyanax mexicanus TaxID=7994 RepID=A0A8B9HEF7_ASTMX